MLYSNTAGPKMSSESTLYGIDTMAGRTAHLNHFRSESTLYGIDTHEGILHGYDKHSSESTLYGIDTLSVT